MIEVKGPLLWTAAWLFAVPAMAQPRPVTFTRDIAPVLFERCAGCHSAGDLGPELLTYRTARPRAAELAQMTARRQMPPWKPDPKGPEFLDSRALSLDEIQLFQDWAAQGAPEGNPADLPPSPKSTADSWRLGTPDLIVTMPEAYTVLPAGPDAFRTFVIPIPVTSARYVKALEFHPGNARVVHHANIGVDRTTTSRRLDERDSEPGYFGGIVSSADYPPGQMLGWTPGQRPRPSAPGTQWRLDPGSDLIVQLHMQPNGNTERVRVQVGLYFTDQAPSTIPVGIRLGNQTLDIPAGESNFVISDRYVLPVSVDLLAVQPHAHNLARRMEAVATLPDGQPLPLISIADWDFRWQEVYRFAQPIPLPAGTAVTMRYVYDNSQSNPRNPNKPPKRVTWGQNTANEMGDLWLQVVAHGDEDLRTLSADVSRRMRKEDLAANLVMLKAHPNDPVHHDTVGILYLDSGRATEAAEHFRESLRWRPDFAPTRYNLGLALITQRRFDAAIVELELAVNLDPAHADAHNTLGAMYHATGRIREAAEQYRIAVTLRPDNIGARTNLTWILAASPDDSLRNPGEAVRVAQTTVDLTQREDASALDTLAAALAATGDFDKAQGLARAALSLAKAAGNTAIASQIELRLRMYEQHRAFRLPQ